MAKTDFRTIDEYIETFPVEDQAILQAVRSAIQAAVPEAEEAISYQIPAFKFHGWVFYFSMHTKHFSLSCPPPSDLYETFETELAPYKKSKSAINFPKQEPVPVDLIRAMAAYRAAENLEKSGGGRASK